MVRPHVFDQLVEDWGSDPTQRREPINEDEVRELCTSELQEAARPKPSPPPRRAQRPPRRRSSTQTGTTRGIGKE